MPMMTMSKRSRNGEVFDAVADRGPGPGAKRKVPLTKASIGASVRGGTRRPPSKPAISCGNGLLLLGSGYGPQIQSIPALPLDHLGDDITSPAAEPAPTRNGAP